MTSAKPGVNAPARLRAPHSAERTWDGLTLQLYVEQGRQDVEWVDDHPDRHLLVANLGGTTSLLEGTLSSGGRYIGPPTLGDMSIIPAGHRYEGVFRGRDIQYASVLIDSTSLPDGAGVVASEMRPQLGITDRFVFACIRELAQVVGQDDPQSQLYGEAVTRALTLKILRGDHTTPDPPPDGRRIPARAIERVQEYTWQNLGERIRVADLADVADMPIGRFLPAFRASFGTSPARWVKQQRVRRARWLIAHTEVPLATVAHDTGFAHQSHMTAALRTLCGTTPLALRSSAAMD